MLDEEMRGWLQGWFWRNYPPVWLDEDGNFEQRAPKAVRHAYLSLVYGSRKAFKEY